MKINNGLHHKYYIQKIVKVPNPDFAPFAKQSQVINNSDEFIDGLIPVDKGAEYFVLRLDMGGFDLEHIKACRIAIHAYADAVSGFLPKLSIELREKYPLI